VFRERTEIYKELEREFNSKVIAYITGDRPNMGTQIASDVIDYFIEHLDLIGPCESISLILYTRGGDTSAARNIVNLLRMYCDNLQVIVPHKAHSAGTIICLGANEILMTKQATLGPIDPSLITPLNPEVNGKQIGVSVEAVKGYLDFIREELKVHDDKTIGDIFIKLSDMIHPLVLGEVYRSKSQIQMMAKKLLKNQVTDDEKIKTIIDFLCSDSGSHDYTINRREAKIDLGLNVINPTEKQYNLIKSLYDDYNEELQLLVPFVFQDIQGAYSVRRCLLESINGGSDYFSTEGKVIHGDMESGLLAFQNHVTFEGWRHEKLSDRLVINENYNEEGVSYESCDEFHT